MAKFREKSKENQLIIKAKLSANENLDEKAFEFFSDKIVRGLLKGQKVNNKKIEYSGSVGVNMYDKLKNPIGKHDFLFYIEQIVMLFQNLKGTGLDANNIVSDLRHIYINEATKELQFIYLPLKYSTRRQVGVTGILYDIIDNSTPLGEKDDYISKFDYTLQGLNRIELQTIDSYIMEEDFQAVRIIRGRNIGKGLRRAEQSGDYYTHYHDDSKDLAQDTEDTVLLTKEEIDGYLKTGLLMKGGLTGYLKTGLLSKEGLAGYLGTGVLTKNDIYEFKKTGLLSDEELTGILNYTPPKAEQNYGATGVVSDYRDSGVSLEYNETGVISDCEDIGVIREDCNVGNAKLVRSSSNETIRINKAVFRIGKERNSCDYFVSDNNAVSRRHADIIQRSERYYIVDLNSSNKTFVNGIPITPREEEELHEGDRVVLGNEEFIFYSN